jgi:uncharacterized membrane protein (DUF106 family)
MIYLMNYWKEIAVAVVVGMLVWYVQSLRIDNEKLGRKNERLQAHIELQNAMIEANKVDYDGGMKEYEKVKVVNRTVYKDKIKVIYKWEDKNATCSDVMVKFDSYQY